MLDDPADQFPAYRANVESTFLQTLEQAPAFAERVRQGRREERFSGTAEMLNYFRTPYGPGWALVGDAGYHKDSITAQGSLTRFATRSCSQRQSTPVSPGRAASRQPWPSTNSSEIRRRSPQYDLACQFAMMAPPSPEQQLLFTALRGNQARDGAGSWVRLAGQFQSPSFSRPTTSGESRSRPGLGPASLVD